ncbi:MAG: hypothetical protein OIN86_13060 [Candidatus Methanoperedens sp.]|nr:hypothetical protein [Candidatus Methanoperedens sp.]CAG0948917.1 hypothetical protein METP1_00067 [Methanosarcinales archaeon]
MARKGEQNLLVYVLLAAVILGGIYMFSTPSQPASINYQPAQQPTYVSPDGVPSNVAPTTNRGTLSFLLTNSLGDTGTSSSMVLLNPAKHAVMAGDKLDEEATRYALMKLHQEKGLGGMTSFSSEGAPQALTASSGAWSTTLSGKIGDKVLVYTYADTTPAGAENVSTVNLVTLMDFYRETGTWVAANEEGKDGWQLYNYARYNFTDATDTNATNYTYFDGGSADTDKVITWYTQSPVQGEECVDCSVYITAPSNYTSNFKSLTVTDNFGQSVKFDSVQGKAENFVGPVNTASTVIASDGVSDHYIYYVGSIKSLNTLRTSSDANRLTWQLKSDTYGTGTIPIRFSVVENSGGLIKNNGVFRTGAALAGQAYMFTVFLDGGSSTSGFSVAPTSQ